MPTVTYPEVRWYSPPVGNGELVGNLSIGPVSVLPDLLSPWMDPSMIDALQQAKAGLDALKKPQVRQARSEANPLEQLGSHIFINRAALKMAELDSIFNLLANAVRVGEPLRWVDIAAGPGGFSEYGMWRTRRDQEARGKTRGTTLTDVPCARVIGVTLSNGDDFRPSDFNVDTPIETFKAIYGPDGTGDLYDPRVTAEMRKVVMQETNGCGVMLVTADGGIDVSGHEWEQERLLLPLIMEQLAAGLDVLQTGGTLVCKLFATTLPCTLRALWLVISGFDMVAAIKPVTSRPGNSEHYLIARGMRPITRAAVDAKVEILRKASLSLRVGLDKINLPDFELPASYVDWVRKSNHLRAMAQIYGLRSIVECSKSRGRPHDNTRLLSDCLKQWNLPSKIAKRKRTRATWPQDATCSLNPIETAGVVVAACD